MRFFSADLGQIRKWVISLNSRGDVFFPIKTGKNNFRFEAVTKEEDIQFDAYLPTIVPPVKKLMPARETLFSFQNGAEGMKIEETLDREFRTLVGVRPCDLKGIFLMDVVFSKGVKDPYYLTRRNHTAIIAYNCPSPCDEQCFCDAVDSLQHEQGADVLLTPLTDQFMVEARTALGEELLSTAGFATLDDGPAKKVGFQASRPEPFGRQFARPLQDIPELLQSTWKSPVWEQHVEACFSCGTCNLVCPTCYCFDVTDDLNLDTVSGQRTRSWDACMLPEFAEVAGGHNFRPDPAGRQRHRVKKKFEYLPMKIGHGASCTGCGRCGRQCTSGIDIFDIVNDLIEEVQ
jgi:sulfhydrogenase subunit beta (sulfur reductase)